MKLIFLLAFTAFLSKCSSSNGDPTPVTKPTVSITSTPVTEGTDAVFTITLSNSSVSATTINMVTTPNTASTADYTTTNVSKTIPVGQTSITVNIPTNNDSIGEVTETFTVTGTVTSNNTANTAPIIAIGTIIDNGIVLASELDIWLTKGDQSVLLQKQNTTQLFGTTANSFQTITIDENQTYQTIDGFGYTLTGGSVEVINSLNATKKQELLQEL